MTGLQRTCSEVPVLLGFSLGRLPGLRLKLQHRPEDEVRPMSQEMWLSPL